MPPAGFEPTIPASERPQTHSLDRAATGIGRLQHSLYKQANIDNIQALLHQISLHLYCKGAVTCFIDKDSQVLRALRHASL